MKMVAAHARLLTDGELGAEQPPGAVAAWREHVLPPEGCDAATSSCFSELMLLYQTTRSSYGPESELTVDYGNGYKRDYASGSHRPSLGPMHRPARVDAGSPAEWPEHVPGWWNGWKPSTWVPRSFEELLRQYSTATQ